MPKTSGKNAQYIDIGILNMNQMGSRLHAMFFFHVFDMMLDKVFVEYIVQYPLLSCCIILLIIYLSMLALNSCEMSLELHIGPTFGRTSDQKNFHDNSEITFINKTICYGPSLELPHWGSSNEGPQHTYFLVNYWNYHILLIWGYVFGWEFSLHSNIWAILRMLNFENGKSV